MKTFYYFLSEQPSYPNKILAKNKAEVKSLLMESLADESSILSILSEEEMNIKSSSSMKAIYADASEFNNGNDFMNAVIKSASEVASINPVKNNPVIREVTSNKMTSEISCNSEVNECNESTKFFEEAGIKFKLENGKLYKKVWKNLTSSNDSEFRIMNVKTNKEVDSSKFRLEKLDWEEI